MERISRARRQTGFSVSGPQQPLMPPAVSCVYQEMMPCHLRHHSVSMPKTFRQETNDEPQSRSTSRHARHAHSEGAIPWAAAWLRHHSADSQDVRRNDACGTGSCVSRALSHRTKEMGEVQMGAQRDRTASKVLHTD